MTWTEELRERVARSSRAEYRRDHGEDVPEAVDLDRWRASLSTTARTCTDEATLERSGAR